MPDRSPVPDELETVIRKGQPRPILRQKELRRQTQLAPDALDAIQALRIVIDQRHRRLDLCQRHTVDAADPGHAVQRRLQHGVEAVAALEGQQEVVEHEALIDQAETFVVVGEIVRPGGLGGRHHSGASAHLLYQIVFEPHLLDLVELRL